MIGEKIHTAIERIDKAIETYHPIAVYALFSGGHDSFSSTYCASRASRFGGAVHINTGIGVEATREYVRKTCRDRGWNLKEYKAWENVNAEGHPDPQVYCEIVRKYGFPGPAGHSFIYSKLKERLVRQLGRDCGATARGINPRRMLLISGCRSQESTRRMANTEEIQIDGNKIWCAPIHDWSKLDTSECLEYANQPRNLVVDLIHKSGECLCGAFAKPGELEELNLWDITRPAYIQITELEREVSKIHPWGWGERPPRRPKNQKPLPLCWSCQK